MGDETPAAPSLRTTSSLFAAYASHTENQDTINASVVQACGDYREEVTGKLKRITKGITGSIIELCSCNRTEELEANLEHNIEGYAVHGLRVLVVAYEELDGNDHDHVAEGNGFELIGLLATALDMNQTIDDALALDVKILRWLLLAIAKETGRRLGLGDHMYPAKVFKDGPAPGGKHASLNEMIMDADGFAGVFSEHKYEIVKQLQGLQHLCTMTGDGPNDAPALSRANIGVSIKGATDATRDATDIALTEPDLSTIVHAIRSSRIIFQCMCNYWIYACAITIHIVVCFAILAFVYKFDFDPSVCTAPFACCRDAPLHELRYNTSSRPLSHL
ncbi:Plasma membrane ATPase [Mycena venus]|uniref:Plasma membrane ATPase n=1 Tax=Mycena venus TaxID=2733690 RepID=A0A8H6XPF6_9AGAR|nr:Plasma membrane ATPase [Mycena venus]